MVVQKLSNGARHIIDFSQEGVNFVFGPTKNMPYRWPNYRRLFRLNSAPMIALLSLANSESHNFTAEVLLRRATHRLELHLAEVS